MSKKKKQRGSTNLKINTRIVLTSVLAIIIPVILIASFSTIFVGTISSYFNLSTVTTNTYSAINQLQWSQTTTSIAAELINDNHDDNEKLKALSNFVKPLEDFNSYICIERDGVVFYETDEDTVKSEQKKVLETIDKNKNINIFGADGLFIVNHTQKNEQSPKYTIIIVNDDYIVNDVSPRLNTRQLTNLLLGRTGIIIMIIIMLFIISIVVISFITSKTIVEPIKKIAHGADEIARGNLDYEIDFKSKNELGQTVDSFNDMRRRLKVSIEQQQNAEKERKVLVAGIAHDLRTPLTSAKGYAEGLIDGIADTPEKQVRYLKTIRSSINDTEKILDDLLTVSRMELGGYELNTTDVMARDFFDDGAEEIGATLNHEGFDFEYNAKCGKDAVICIDVDRFERVIGNIISNSIKYSRKDIKGKVWLNIEEYEHSIIIELADNGIGVDRDSLAKIFDTMFRADPARSMVSQGSGLGLSVCKQIVELHSGSIWARSKPGEGLSIFISLPKKEERQ